MQAAWGCGLLVQRGGLWRYSTLPTTAALLGVTVSFRGDSEPHLTVVCMTSSLGTALYLPVPDVLVN